mmetsp:Transcript_53196/g.171579  ORF Transcript_53196/g.171579 Transcript_53196/m.171579 type:complete len:132 (+) Transcript_53196:822-1217(+)
MASMSTVGAPLPHGTPAVGAADGAARRSRMRPNNWTNLPKRHLHTVQDNLAACKFPAASRSASASAMRRAGIVQASSVFEGLAHSFRSKATNQAKDPDGTSCYRSRASIWMMMNLLVLLLLLLAQSWGPAR